MDVLTTAADAILNDKENTFTPTKDFRPVLRNMTNIPVVHSSKKMISSSFNALLNEKITCSSISKSKASLKTPGKRRKNSQKFGDENLAPSPKTPKNETVKEKFIESPVTPLSNLKMLTRIASMEEHIPSKKNLFEVPEVVHKSKLGLRRCISENTSLSLRKTCVSKPKLKRHPTSSDLDNSIVLKVNKATVKSITPVAEISRRDKSLGLLCERFLDHFPIEVSCLETPRRLVIDDVADVLGTERRRVYDIVNILECLNMASRVQKNMYQWMGKQHLETTLSKLKGLAEEWGIGVHLNSPIEQSLREFKNGNTPGAQSSEKQDARKEKSIGILCQKFLMLFLTSPTPHVIQLDTAIHLLLGQEGDDLEKLRTRGRRIYDIANVLVSLHLITKLPQCKSFQYVGPQVEAAKKEEFDAVSSQSQVKLRHSLLPPPLTAFIHPNSLQSDDLMITPSDNEIPFLRKGKPRKLDTEFIPTRAKRNCLVDQPKSEDVKLGRPSEPSKLNSFHEICKVAEMERRRLQEEPSSGFHPVKSRHVVPFQSIENQKSVAQMTKTYRFSHFGSPRMALTFQNTSSQSPPLLTSKAAAANTNVPRVMVRPPFILHTLNVTNPKQPNPNVNQKPVYVIQTTVNKAPQKGSPDEVNKAGFRVYSRRSNKEMKTLSLPAGANLNGAPTLLKKLPEQQQQTSPTNPLPTPKPLVKSLSQTSIPNISLNTLSRNHYKTVFGSSSQIPSRSLSSPRKGSYRFVINTKDVDQQTSVPSNPKENRQPSFVKILQTSPDNSSTDSELESIFGDSFKFTRPKHLLNKN